MATLTSQAEIATSPDQVQSLQNSTPDGRSADGNRNKTSSPSPSPTPSPTDDQSSDQNHQQQQGQQEQEQEQQQQQQTQSPKTRSSNHDNNKLPWWSIKRFDLTLENKGSVARDHLANERTFLAWMRTSIALASAGVAITQLFRLSGTLYTLPEGESSGPETQASSSNTLPYSNLDINSLDLSQILPHDYQTNSNDAIRSLAIAIAQQSLAVQDLGTHVNSEKNRYQELGKPIGGTFIALSILFLILGAQRYFLVQNTLTRGEYPAARQSVLTAGITVACLVIASFVSIVVLIH